MKLSRPLMLDLCSGRHTAAWAMENLGWEVISVDNNPDNHPTVCMDVRQFHWSDGRRPKLIWASPPCVEFTRYFMKQWHPNAPIPDMSIVLACRRIIEEANPEYYVIENTRGAQTFLGKASQIIGNVYFLWTDLPPLPTKLLDKPGRVFKHQTFVHSEADRLKRAAIPKELSMAVAVTCMASRRLF